MPNNKEQKMLDISVQGLHKYYGSNHVIKGASFEIYSGEKIGLLGRNGSGKTTLFKVIARDEPHESGDLFRAAGKKVEVLAQIPAFGEYDTVDDILRSSFQDLAGIEAAMKKIEGDGDPAVLKRYGRLMDEYEQLGGYEIETAIDKICNGMNIGGGMRGSFFSLLSGGEKTRVNLARILLRKSDILLLDEPTNHLDIASLAWLEGFIREFQGTVAVISHDRAFLDNVVTRIIDIEDGKAYFYSGNYSWYIEEKMRRYATQSELYERQQREIKRIEDRARWFLEQDRFTTKHHAILSRIDHMDKVDKPFASRRVTGDFNGGGYTSKEVVMFDDVHKGYGGSKLMDGVSLGIYRNDRIALIGANGCGKTTLLKLITGEEQADSGSVKVSGSLKAAYMPQIVRFENEGASVQETLHHELGEAPEDRVRSILARYKFMAPDVIKKVGSLSGGEKSRLKLCMLMQNKTNFLMLDEPTNHLDIESREWIEDAVSDYEGTMLFISHDRYFLNKFATKIWSMRDGEVTEYVGSYDDFVKAGAGIAKPAGGSNKTKGGKNKTTGGTAMPGSGKANAAGGAAMPVSGKANATSGAAHSAMGHSKKHK